MGSTTSVYVEVELLGIPVDCMSRKTKPSVKNSLNPIWQETFVFQVLYYIVCDKLGSFEDHILSIND